MDIDFKEQERRVLTPAPLCVKKFLREEMFEDERSILRIEKAIQKTIFEIDGKRISADEVISLMGRKTSCAGWIAVLSMLMPYSIPRMERSCILIADRILFLQQQT